MQQTNCALGKCFFGPSFSPFPTPSSVSLLMRLGFVMRSRSQLPGGAADTPKCVLWPLHVSKMPCDHKCTYATDNTLCVVWAKVVVCAKASSGGGGRGGTCWLLIHVSSNTSHGHGDSMPKRVVGQRWRRAVRGATL